MNSKLFASLSIALALALAGALAYIFTRPPGPKVLSANCASIVPTSNGSLGYGVYLTSQSGQIMLATVHLYYPMTGGGFKHNVNFMVDSTAFNDDGTPTTAALNTCVDAAGQNPTQMTLTAGSNSSTWSFTPSGSNGALTVSTTAFGSTPAMTGSMYLMQ